MSKIYSNLTTISLGLLLVAGVVIIAISQGGKEDLVVATVSRDWFNAPVILAEAELDASDFKIRTIDQKSGLASKIAVQGGNAHIGLASPVPLLRDVSAWENMVILGVYMSSDAVIGVVTRGKDLNSLKPPYGIVRGTISEIYFASLNQQIGGKLMNNPSEILDIQPPDAGLQLKNGSINTAVIWEPHLVRAMQMTEPETNLLTPKGIYSVNVALITSRSALVTHRDGINRFRKLVAEKSSQIASDRDSTRQKIQDLLELGPNTLDRAWDTVDFSFRDSKIELEKILEDEMEALEKAGMLDKNARTGALRMLDY